MWTFEHTETTSATPEQLWVRYSQPPTWPEWNIGMSDVVLDGPFVVGTKGSLKPEDGPKTGFKLTVVEPLRGFTTVSKLPLARLTFVHTIEPLGSGARFTHHATISGTASPMFARVIGPNITARVPGAMRNLARLAEEQASPVA